MRIMCGTDFSEESTAAMNVAGALARRLGDTLELVHVLDVPVPVGPVEGLMGLEQFAVAQRQAVREALNSAAAVMNGKGIKTEPRVMDGPAARGLMEAASATDVRLTVLASHGRGAAERLALGSVADKLTRLTHKPMLVTGHNAGDLALALSEGRALRVVVGMDFGRASDAALALVRTLRELVAMDVTFIHAYWPPGEAQRLGLHGPADIYELDPEIGVLLKAELERKVGTLPGVGTVSVRVVPNMGRPAERVMDLADELHADLVLTGTSGRGTLASLFQGSQSLAMLHTYKGSVLLAPQKMEATGRVMPLPDPRTFLVATDFSVLGNRAVLTALGLARGRAGSVDVLHVMPGQNIPVWTTERTVKQARREEHARVEESLRALIPANSAVTVRVHAVDAPDTAQAIAQAAERLQVDMVVVGSHGKSPAVEVLLGSNAQKLLGLTQKPVVLVRQ